MGEYYYSTTGVAGAISAQNLLTIENPSASTVSVVVTHVRIRSVLTILSLTVFAHKIGRTTALPTGGTTQTAQKQISSDPTASAIIRTASPTASFATGLIMAGPPGLSITAAGTFIPTMTELTPDHPIMLAPGEALLIGTEANLTTWTHFISIAWTES